jgi:hypothetical protein
MKTADMQYASLRVSLGAGTRPEEHAEQGANFRKAEDECSGEVDDTVRAEDHDRGNDRIPVSDGE